MIVSLAKRRGFVFPSSEIYGGFSSTWDYGPMGVELKRNVKEQWWRAMVRERPDIVGLDAAILMAPKVWEASGHLENFTDPLVDCRECKQRFREDQLPGDGRCPNCGAAGSMTAARQFNLMFQTHVGPVEDAGSAAFLRPETAQGIFVNFDNVLTATRRRLPFGIAQIGKSFRNEITPGNFTFRTREFEQMEMEFFVQPGDAPSGTSAGSTCASSGTWTWASTRPTSGATSTRPRSSPTTPPAPPTCSTASPGAGTSWRASPTAPTSTSRRTRGTAVSA